MGSNLYFPRPEDVGAQARVSECSRSLSTFSRCLEDLCANPPLKLSFSMAAAMHARVKLPIDVSHHLAPRGVCLFQVSCTAWCADEDQHGPLSRSRFAFTFLCHYQADSSASPRMFPGDVAANSSYLEQPTAWAIGAI
jgi:hypothetical protein